MKRGMTWYDTPKILDAQVASGKPWETAGRGEQITWSDETFRVVGDALRGCFFGLVAEILDSGIASAAVGHESAVSRPTMVGVQLPIAAPRAA